MSQNAQINSSSTTTDSSRGQNNNVISSSSSGCFLRIESVHLLIHHNNQIYRKLLAPEPNMMKTHSSTLEHFIKTIRLMNGCEIQFEFDFRIVGSSPEDELNLLFHEIIQEERKTCSFFVENMGKFKSNTRTDSYLYTTTLSNCSKSFGQFSLVKSQSIRLEVCDLERTSWFIGEWRVKMVPTSNLDEFYEWLRIGQTNNRLAIPQEEGSDLEAAISELKEETPYHRSLMSSRSPSPLSQSESSSLSIDYSTTTKSPTWSPLRSPSESLAASFEDLEMSDFASVDHPIDSDDSLSLPHGTNSAFQDRLLLSMESSDQATSNDQVASNDPNTDILLLSSSTSPMLSRQNSLTPTRSITPTTSSNSLSTVDIFHQVGSLFFGSDLGQFVVSSIKKDPNESNLKTSYSTSTIHLLGVKYQLKGLLSNVLLMESDDHPEAVVEDDEEIEVTKLTRFNSFCSFLKRSPAPPKSLNCMFIREILLLKRAGPLISGRLKDWFESFNWTIEGFSSATLLVSNFLAGCRIEIKIYSMKPNSTSPANTPELFLVELVLTRTDSASLKIIAESNAYFVELTAFIVQLELSEARRSPEIVLMETWNSHVEPERIGQSRIIPIVKFSVIPPPSEGEGHFYKSVYFWSDHLQGWLLQNLSLQGLLLSLHPLLDASMAIQINLSGSHLKISKDSDGQVGNFSLITSRGHVYNFRVLEISDLKEIIGRIRFAMLSRASPSSTRTTSRRNGSLLQVDKIYRTSISSGNNNGGNNLNSSTGPSEQEMERIRTLNISVMDAFLEDFRSRFWFTYRRGFPRIEPSLFTTDLGWGCMLRTGQCLMAEALSRFYFGRKWRLWQLEEVSEDNENDLTASTTPSSNFNQNQQVLMRQFYLKISKKFVDQLRGEYSVHRLAIEGAKIGTPIGQWFGPSIIGKVLKSITNGLKDSPFWVYSSQAGVFPTSHLLKIVATRAVLILLPLRLGLDEVNPIYGNFIRGALRTDLSLGIVGGLPDKSLYFVGYQDWDLLFLDPHILKPAAVDIDNSNDQINNLIQDFHTSRVRSIPLDQLDPSMLFGFLCCSAEEIVQLRDHLEKLNRHANILTIKN